MTRYPTLERTYPARENNVNQAQLHARGWRIAGELAGFTPAQAKQFSQIVKGESGYRPGVLGHDPGGSTGIGGPQNTPGVWGASAIAYMHKLGGEKALRNPLKAAKMAKFLFDAAGGTWSPWVGTRYLGPADPNARALSRGRATGGGPARAPKYTPGKPEGFDTQGFIQDRLGQHHSVKGALKHSFAKDYLREVTDPTSKYITPGTAGKVTPGKVPKAPKGGGYTSNGKGKLAGHQLDRAGVATNKKVLNFAQKVADQFGGTITLGTGTNHSQMTTSGNVSDHWAGNALDLPATGKKLTRMGRAALIAAGMSHKQARQAKGGIYNVGGKQIIFNTTEGGNHWNHLHIGVP